MAWRQFLTRVFFDELLNNVHAFNVYLSNSSIVKEWDIWNPYTFNVVHTQSSQLLRAVK